MRTLTELEAYLSGLKTKNQEAIKKLTDQIEIFKQNEQKATEAIAKAQLDFDNEAYNTAKSDLWTAQNGQELYGNKKKELETAPLISEQDYNKLVAEINQSTRSENQTQLDEAVELLKPFVEFAYDLENELNKGNEILQFLQREVKRIDVVFDNNYYIYEPNGTKCLKRLPEIRDENTLFNFISKLEHQEIGRLAGAKAPVNPYERADRLGYSLLRHNY